MRKKFLILFTILSCLCLTIFNFTQNIDKEVFADELPTYFSVTSSNNEKVNNNGSIRITDAQFVTIALNNDSSDLKSITSISPQIKLNNKDLSTGEIKSMIAADGDYDIKTDDKTGAESFVFKISGNKIFSNVRDDNSNLYGKFDLSIDYYINENGNTLKHIDFTFYLLKYDNYNIPEIKNAIKKDSSLTAYNRVYTYRYDTKDLPTVYVDGKYFDVEISKKVGNSNAEIMTAGLRVSNGEYVLTTNNTLDGVYITKNPSDEQMKIVFNSLAEFEITYKAILHLDNEVINLVDLNGNAMHTTDKINFYGFNLYHANGSNPLLKQEFVKLDESGNILERTDYTYLEIDNGDDSEFVDLSTNKLNSVFGKINFASTNQKPVQIVFNEALNLEDSYYYMINENQELIKNTETGFYTYPITTNFFSNSGTYILKLVSGTKESETHTQWFAFKITTKIQSFFIGSTDAEEVADKTETTIISSGTYTAKNVAVGYQNIPSVFDDKTTLTVNHYNYQKTLLNTYIVETTSPMVFTENGYYEIKLLNSDNITGTTGFFYIDKEEITDYSVYSVEKNVNSKYVKNQNIEFLTNSSIALSFGKKSSGAMVSCEYKFFPMTAISGEYLDVFNQNQDLEVFYKNWGENNYSIPVLYQISYSNSVISILYTQSNNLANIGETSILSDAGIYVFRLFDDAGNEKFVSVCIDTSSPVVLQEREDGHFEKVENINTVSADTTLYFGKYKILEMLNFDTVSDDVWLKSIAEPNATYFTRHAYASVYKNYLRVPIENTVYYSVGGQQSESYILSEENNYSYVVKAFINDVANENQYKFYVRDKSNTNFESNTEQTYLKRYSTVYNIRVNFDASKLNIYFSNADGEQESLYLNSYFTENQLKTQKNQYFNPTNKNTFYDDEVVYISFVVEPYEDVIEVESVTIEYYPFVFNEQTMEYDYSKTAEKVFNVYKYNYQTNLVESDLTTTEGDIKSYPVYSVYDYTTNKNKTMEGKYVIKRVYHEFAETITQLSQKNDYQTRVQTFYIDKNSIITAPEMVSEEVGMVSYVGGAIRAKITNDNFTEIYLAQNYNENASFDGSYKTILTTNKLPVQLYIPSVKYANSTISGFTYADANYFDANDKYSIINYLTLRASVTKYTDQASLENNVGGTTIFDSGLKNDSGYLNIPNLKDSGYYKVVISQNDPTASDFIFVFKIEYSKPNFNLTDVDDIELKSLNQYYYTNQNTFKVKWTDPDNIYMAKIEPSTMTYTIMYKDGSSVIKNVNVSNYNANEKNHTSVIDITNEENVLDIAQIIVSAQYAGNEEDFPSGYFKETKTIIIDKTAPTENISKLLNKSGLIAYKDQIRDTSNSIYNISQKTGDFEYFAFAMDYSELYNIITKNQASGEEAYDIWYIHMPNKYNESYYQETDPKEFVASGSYTVFNNESFIDFQRNGFNTYYEFIESDLAGNLTIYTIYLTNNQTENSTKSLFTWKTELLEKEQVVTKLDASKNMTIYSKVNFNLETISLYRNYNVEDNYGYPWYYLSINGDIYYHTPYLENNVLSDGKFTYTLKALTTLGISNKMQKFVIGNVPYFNSINLDVGVLSQDKVLSYSHFGQSNIYKDEVTGEYVFYDLENNEILRAKEGIIIELPQTMGDTASVFASKLEIREPRNENENLNDNVIYTLEKDLSSTDAVLEIPESNAIGVITYQAQGKTYAVFYVKNPASNQYYIYTITDNFGENYNVIVIFGEEVADESWNSSVPIKKILNNNVNYYYSTDTMYFNFNSVKNYIEFKIGDNVYSTKNSADLNLLKKADNGLGIHLTNINNSAIYRVEILAPSRADSVNGQFGGSRQVEVTIKINLNSENSLYSTKYVAEIYNVIPQINLFDKNNNNVNAIFTDFSMIVGYPITVKFADTSSNTYPNIVYLKNNETGEIFEIQSGYIINEEGNFSIVIAYDKSSIYGEDIYNTIKNFTIYDSSVDFYEVYIIKDGVQVAVEETGKTYSFRDVTNSNNETIIYSHYIVNTAFNIACNEAQKITYTQYVPTIVSGSIRTYIYRIYNTNASSENTNINYFEKLVAVTVIPETTEILDKLSNENAQNDVLYDAGNDIGIYSRTFMLESGDTSNGTLKLSWNSYYGIKENTVNVYVYDETGKLLTPEVETNNNLRYVYLDESGYYNLTFKDIAGNTQYFGANNKYMVTFVSSVIFKINGDRPINNSIYDGEVEISIPSSTLSLYDNRAVPRITVYKNGKLIELNTNNKTSYTFTSSGFYRIRFSAIVGSKALREEDYTFTIINPNETRWAYEFQEYSTYYIEKVVKNGYDITQRLVDRQIGKIVNIDGKDYLKNVLISLYDEQTGAGEYTLSVKTNDINNATFTFSFWIHNANPPIYVSVEEGTETTDKITVTFNIFNLYDEVRDCTISITGMSDIVINQEYLDQLTESESNGVRTITLQEARTYYIQVFSEGGNLLYSYRVDKKEPLNTISIIIIIVASIAVVSLVVMFIVLRKRVKIR